MPGGPEYPVLGGVEHKIGAVPPIYSTQGGAAPSVTPDFIGSVTAVYTPELRPGEIFPAFISSVSAVYTPSLNATDSTAFTVPGTYTWLCPPGVTTINVYAYGGGGGGGSGDTLANGGGGGGGAFAADGSIPVTPGNTYTVIVGAAGVGVFNANGTDGGDSSFVGDSGSSVVAKAGKHGLKGASGGAGGLASASTGATKNDGGAGGNTSGGAFGGGGGASGNISATGAAGNSGGGGAGGVGANGGGSGGQGGAANHGGGNGFSPGGGGGAGGTQSGGNTGGNAAGGAVLLTTKLLAPFIASVTVVYTPQFPVQVPFISSHTVVYTPTLPPSVNPSFISSRTVVYPIMSLFDPNKVYGGPGNGGEAFVVELNVNGVTTTATLAADLGVGMGTMLMTGDSGMPTTVAFVVTIDSEQIYVFPRGGGSYAIHGRGLGNTAVATHTAGATVSWGDSYDLAIVSTADIGHNFTANINASGSTTYPGWLVAFDASQAYLSGSRYPMHVTELVGVFAAGTGVGGTNLCDASQPNAICVPAATSDDCPAALSNPARISSDITTGDIAVVRYTNPEGAALDLGPRAVTLQSWYGLKRVDTTDHDVTFTDPTGIVVDTTGAQLTFTGSVQDTWLNPSSIGISPITGLPTPNNVPYTTVTLPGTDRKMTFGSGGGGYNEKGWPICCLAVRQGPRRVPFWQSFDWHNFSFVYTGFGTDALFAQLVINQNGIIYNSVPDVNFPGPQDTDGPDAVWDDGSYHFGTAWYVAIYNTPYLVFGPTIGGAPVTTPPGGPAVPTVSFPSGGGGTPAIIYPSPPYVEGGEGGDINPGVAGLHVWGTSGKGFS